MKQLTLLIMSGLLLISAGAQANDVEIKKVSLKQQDSSTWSADVTLNHADNGWEHYADAWRLLDESGKLLGTRVLYHPHTQQPFTRSLKNIKIPAGTNIIFVEAHDKVHGWSSQRIKIDLTTSSGKNYHIRRQ